MYTPARKCGLVFSTLYCLLMKILIRNIPSKNLHNFLNVVLEKSPVNLQHHHRLSKLKKEESKQPSKQPSKQLNK